jgi:hypothetical protein
MPIAHVAAAMGISRRCASKWWHRWLELGVDGLHDRSSRPRRSPTKTPPIVEERICRRRRSDKVGPDRLAIRLGLSASTIYRVLVRNDLSRLGHLDRATATPIRRYERSRPGELVHVDVKKLGRMFDGGGHRVHGRANAYKPRSKRGRTGYTYLHTAIDDHSRVAYTEALANESEHTCAAFWRRATAWFGARGVAIERVLTDNTSPTGAGCSTRPSPTPASPGATAAPTGPRPTRKFVSITARAAPVRSDPGQGVTMVSFVRCVGRTGAALGREPAGRN